MASATVADGVAPGSVTAVESGFGVWGRPARSGKIWRRWSFSLVLVLAAPVELAPEWSLGLGASSRVKPALPGSREPLSVDPALAERACADTRRPRTRALAYSATPGSSRAPACRHRLWTLRTDEPRAVLTTSAAVSPPTGFPGKKSSAEQRLPLRCPAVPGQGIQ